jgi:hypothetical protein
MIDRQLLEEVCLWLKSNPDKTPSQDDIDELAKRVLVKKDIDRVINEVFARNGIQ